MNQSGNETDHDRTESIEIDLSESEFRRLVRLVEREGVELEAWVREVLMRAARSGDPGAE